MVSSILFCCYLFLYMFAQYSPYLYTVCVYIFICCIYIYSYATTLTHLLRFGPVYIFLFFSPYLYTVSVCVITSVLFVSLESFSIYLTTFLQLRFIVFMNSPSLHRVFYCLQTSHCCFIAVFFCLLLFVLVVLTCSMCLKNVVRGQIKFFELNWVELNSDRFRLLQQTPFIVTGSVREPREAGTHRMRL